MIRILVVGASGFIGKNLLLYFNKKNYNVLFTYNKNVIRQKNSIRYSLGSKLPDEIINFKPEIIINLAWQGIPNFNKKICNLNLVSHKKFIDQLRNFKNLKKVIYMGSCAEYYKESIHYDEYKKYKHFISAKKNIYKYLNTKKLNFKWLRVFYLFGPYQRETSLMPLVINNIRKNKNYIKLKNSGYSQDFIFIDNLSIVINYLIFKRERKKIYDVGMGKSTSISNIVFKINKCMKKNIKLVSLNTNVYKKTLLANNDFEKLKFKSVDYGIKKTVKFYQN